MHGTTTHGVQVDGPRHRSTPTAYYSPSSGISLAATRLVRRNDIPGQESGVHFGIVGMGIGTMSAFARAGDRVRYYEINRSPRRRARRVAVFTFVKDSAAQVTVVAGDARLSLERELAGAEPQRCDLLVMDAFANDSVPVHLVTVEAFRLYTAHLRSENSILAVNVTNRYIDLEPGRLYNRPTGIVWVWAPIAAGYAMMLLTGADFELELPRLHRHGRRVWRR